MMMMMVMVMIMTMMSRRAGLASVGRLIADMIAHVVGFRGHTWSWKTDNWKRNIRSKQKHRTRWALIFYRTLVQTLSCHDMPQAYQFWLDTEIFQFFILWCSQGLRVWNNGSSLQLPGTGCLTRMLKQTSSILKLWPYCFHRLKSAEMKSLRDLSHLYGKCEKLEKRYSLLKTFIQVQDDSFKLIVNNAKICWNN